ncbi:MAG: EamA family transporter RarD [Phycisphaerales bacterium]|nr:EamA family transporter RarD [Phycisphaerales bacterium]
MTRPDAPYPDHSHARAGLLYGLAAHATWGLMPIYIRLLAEIPPTVVLAHRVLWSAVFLVVLVSIAGGWRPVVALVRDPRARLWILASAVCIGVNWLVFIEAVASGRVLQSSLGYFINPLVNVGLGMLFLGERPRPRQWVAIGLAAVGVGWLTVAQGGVPWIALTLAVSFGLYGLLRKRAPAGPVPGLLAEVLLMLPAAAAWLWVYHAGYAGVVPLNAPSTIALLSLIGVLTSLPLIWFAVAARRLPMVTLGFLQYLTPTLQFIVAVALFHEVLSPERLSAFGIVWAGVLVFVADSARRVRERRYAADARDALEAPFSRPGARG